MLPQCWPSVVQEKSSFFTISSHHSWDRLRSIPFYRCPWGHPTPFCPCPSPADLNTPAAVIGCGAWEARNPRPLWAAHVENAGSSSRGLQGQSPQISPGLTQSGNEVDGQDLAVGASGLNTGGPVEPKHSPGVFAAQLTGQCWVLPREHTGIANTLFQQHKRRLYTWTSPDGWHRNQIDYIVCSQRWRSTIQSAKTRRFFNMLP